MFGILPDSYFRDSPVASLGRRVSLVPNISSFQHGPTSSNTYAFVWNGARDGRINGEPFDGSVELFRNGDVSVTTNGVSTHHPRVIYRQVGVSFYLDSVTVTNIPDAFNLLYESTTNDVWNFDRLVNIGHDTGGIECYFVNDFWHEDGRQNRIAAANCVSGMVLTAKANVPTLAHEIGHFFGLQDVYLMASEKDEDVQGSNAKDVSGDCVKYASCLLDWNGGCNGERTGGARYYPLGTTWSAIMPRLVMYGIQRDDGERRDITRGDVDGVSYIGSGSERIWYDVLALVGFFESGTEHPSHQ